MQTKLLVFFVIITELSYNLYAQSFKNPPESVSSISQAGAFVAQSDDASSISFNPAGLVQIKNGELMFGFTYLYSKTEYRELSGIYNKKYNPSFLPYLYYVPDLENNKFKFGIGINFPYGQSTEWPKDVILYWSSQYPSVPFYSNLQTIKVSPAFSFKFNENFSFGFSPDIYCSKLTIKSLDQMGGITKIDVIGQNIGGNLGFLYKNNNLRLGASYKPSFKIKYDGDITFSNIGNFDCKTELKFPERYTIGIAFYPSSNFKIELDVENFDFSNFKKIPIEIASPYPFIPSYTEILKNWKKVNNLYFGIEYSMKENIKLKCGMANIKTPIPESTWEPSLPDADTVIICFGIEQKTKIGDIEISFLFSNPEKIKKEGNYAGEYKSKGFFVTIGIKRQV